MASTVFGDFVFKISAPVRDAINNLQDWDSQLEDTVDNISELADSSNDVYEQMADDIHEFDKEFGDTIEDQTELIKASKASWVAFGVAAAAAITGVGYSVLKWSPHMQMYASLMSVQMQRLGIEIGKILAPLMKLVTDVFKGFTDWFIALGDNGDAVGMFFKYLIVAAGLSFAGLAAFSIIAKGLSWIFGIGEGTGFLSTLKNGAIYMGDLMAQIAKAGWTAFTGFIGFLAVNPIVAFVLALAAIVVAITSIVAMSAPLTDTQAAIMEVNTVLGSYITKLNEIEEINKRVFGEQGGQMVNSMWERNEEIAEGVIEEVGKMEDWLQETGFLYKTAQETWFKTQDQKDFIAEYERVIDLVESSRQAARSLVSESLTFKTDYIGTIEDLKVQIGDIASMYERLTDAMGLDLPASEVAGVFKQAMEEYGRGISESLADMAKKYVGQLSTDNLNELNALSKEYDDLRISYRDSGDYKTFAEGMDRLKEKFKSLEFIDKIIPEGAQEDLARWNKLWQERKKSDEQYQDAIDGFMEQYGTSVIQLGNNMATYDAAQLVLADHLKTNTGLQDTLNLKLSDSATEVNTFSGSIIDAGDAAVKGAEKMKTAQKSFMGVMADTLGSLGFGGVSSIMRSAEKAISYTTINNNQTINAGSGVHAYGSDLTGMIGDMNSAKTYENNTYYQQSQGGSSGY